MNGNARRRKYARILAKQKEGKKLASDEKVWLALYEKRLRERAPTTVPANRTSDAAASGELASYMPGAPTEPRLYETSAPSATEPTVGPADVPPPGAADSIPVGDDVAGDVQWTAPDGPTEDDAPPPPAAEPQPRQPEPPAAPLVPGPLATAVATGLTFLLKRGVEHDLRPILAEEMPELPESEREGICEMTVQGYHALALQVCAKYLNAVDLPYIPEGLVLGGAAWGVSSIIRQRKARKAEEERKAEEARMTSAADLPRRPTAADVPNYR